MTTDPIRAGITEKRPFLHLAEKWFFGQKSVFFFKNYRNLPYHPKFCQRPVCSPRRHCSFCTLADLIFVIFLHADFLRTDFSPHRFGTKTAFINFNKTPQIVQILYRNLKFLHMTVFLNGYNLWYPWQIWALSEHIVIIRKERFCFDFLVLGVGIAINSPMILILGVQ